MRTDTPEHPAHDHLHGSHPAIINRLKRANGHLNRVIQMLEQNRHCNDIAQQLYAVEKSIEKAKRLLIADHIDHCMTHILEADDPQQELEAFREITKYL
ncbi:metal-sensing transcriptional repressor [Testudinibacter sp. TR-2022]|uniref:metal-sensing transcriptional repressor n=1 Tax=Testudinibacter sp. TR-2022 TaxID=2585029 RepID=UPI00111A1250|nr:metal-sensing transcriptional repressor [Testudinibacter sp. TR-2022]TNH09373.1 metal-sensing transcriptional repressor [Pasteurellaceae bacterium Phil11]TNH29399.1 metal-sensing transcriptional repressor [Testudinibacter sp. TR-2022]